MLTRILNVLAVLALWMVFECWVSWQAFCQNPNYQGGPDNSAEENYCVFNGPIAASARAFTHWWGHVFDKPDAYVALFTAVLAVCTLALWWATYGLQKGTRKQIKLARDEFRSSHRPRMRLKHAWFPDQTAWRLNGPLEITLDFVNVGNTDARITWINYQSLILPTGQRLPQRPPYDEPVAGTVRITRFRTDAMLPSGVTLPRTVCDGILDTQEVMDILWGHRQLYLIGTIEYWDFAGVRQTAFCRRFTYNSYPPAVQDMGRFEIEKDPDYEYED